MLQRSLGLLIMGLVLTGAAEPASTTCIFVPALPHHVDAALRRSDASAPASPLVVAVDAFRRNGMTCTRQSCVANSCGDTGTVRIDLAPSADDVTPPEKIGYRLILVRGELPSSMSDSIGVTLAGGRPIYLRPTFEELPTLDVELAAVAVDAAGNESEPTEPFVVRFDGCTLAAVGDRCEDEIDPETDLSNVLGGELGEDGEPAQDEDVVAGAEVGVFAASAGGGCSMSGRSSNGSGSGVLATFVALVSMLAGLARRRRPGNL